MSVVVRDTRTIHTSGSLAFHACNVLDPVYLGDYGVSDTLGWPGPSDRPTTSRSAVALERATIEDETPRLDEVEIDDGFGI